MRHYIIVKVLTWQCNPDLLSDCIPGGYVQEIDEMRWYLVHASSLMSPVVEPQWAGEGETWSRLPHVGTLWGLITCGLAQGKQREAHARMWFAPVISVASSLLL